jgi:hypothetical protein
MAGSLTIMAATPCAARATQQHSADIQQLRLEAYRAAPEFQLSDERSLAWGREDAEGIVLAVWHAGVMVSTTRGNILRDSAAAERFMEFHAAHDCAIASIAGVVLEGAPQTRLMRRRACGVLFVFPMQGY